MATRRPGKPAPKKKTAGAAKRKGAPGAPEETRAGVHARHQQMATDLRRHLEDSPTMAKSSSKSLLPTVESISLDDLKVEVPGPKTPTDDQLKLMFRGLMREHGERRQRAAGEKIEEGDEILVDMLGYNDGKLMPFVGRQDLTLYADSFFDHEKLGRSLIGETVDSTAVIDAALPDDFAEESWRGFPYKAAIVIRNVIETKPPEELTPELLKRIDRGGDLKEILASLRAQAWELSQTAAEARAQGKLMDILFERTGVTIPLEAVQEEIREYWRRTEGALFARQGIEKEEMASCLESWLKTGRILKNAENKLRARLVVDAVAQANAIVATEADVTAAIAELKQAMASNEALPQATIDAVSVAVRDLKTLAYINDKATVVIGDPQ